MRDRTLDAAVKKYGYWNKCEKTRYLTYFHFGVKLTQMAEPKSFKCRFIEPGVISYEDSKQGTVFVSKEALDRMAPSFRNCPVIFIPEKHDDSDKSTAFNFNDIGSNPACGIVTGKPYWGDDGWQYVEMAVWDDDALKAIEQGFSVSCAYEPDKVDDAGGQWHQIAYDNAVLDGHYMHMAIVPDPRYEGSRILKNSKGGNMAPFGIGKPKNAAAAPAPAPEKKPDDAGAGDKPEMLNAEDTKVDVNGVPVPLYELIEAFKMKQGAGSTPAQLTPDDVVQVEGFGDVTVADLIAAYGEGSGDGDEGESLENAEAPTDAQGQPAVKEAMKNAAPKKPAVNSSLRNAARSAGGAGRPEIDDESSRIARGSERYSIPAKQGGK